MFPFCVKIHLPPSHKGLLLLVALGAVLGSKCCTAFLVAGAAELARVDARHGDCIPTFFHAEHGFTGCGRQKAAEAARMTIAALKTCFCVCITAKDNFAAFFELQCLAGTDGKRDGCQNE
jgi:hypothetical protein